MTQEPKQVECFKCGKKMREDEVSVGMNAGFGEYYWCRECAPPATSPEEVAQAFERFINPPKEPGK